MKLRILADAERELLDAQEHYEQCRPGLGADFLGRVQNAFYAIQRTPLRFPKYEGGNSTRRFRRARVVRFPYLVVYLIHGDEIIVSAVAHASRKPNYWEGRF